MIFPRPLLAVYLLILLTGCTQLFKPPADDVPARIIIGRLIDHNKELTQFKGLAKVQMISEGRSQSGRIAFAAIWPDKMRVELLNMMGAPLTTLAGDGDDIRIISHIDNKKYRIRQSPTALEPVIHLPVGIEDLQSLLSGRVPLPPHAFAQLMETDGPEDVVLLKNRWHGLISKLKVDSKTHQIKNMQVYDAEGELRYQIQWHLWKAVGGYILPSKVIIESFNLQRLILSVDRIWPNIEVSPSTFVIDLPQPPS